MPKRERYHHGDLKSASLEAGWQALRSAGAEQLSVRDIAQTLGVTHRAVYRHYPDKAALLNALAARGAGAIAAHLNAAGADPVERLSAYVGFALDEPHVFRLVFTRDPDSIKDDAGLQAALAEMITAGQATFRRPSSTGQTVREGAIRYWAVAHGLAELFLSGVLGHVAPDTASRYARDQIVRLIAEDDRRQPAQQA
jgi:AcrR family transcriptional regulator